MDTPTRHPAGAPAELGPIEQLRAGRLPRRLAQLVVGLTLYGASMAMMIRGALGLDAWDVLHLGLAGRTGWNLGLIIDLVGLVVLLAWIPLRQPPGLGTVLNVAWVGPATSLTLLVLPVPSGWPARAGMLAAGIVLNGLAGALYLGARLGPGPRDGLMTGLARRTGRSLRLVRTGLELTVLAAGWLLGGPVGIGTVAYALAIGPLVQAMLPLVGVRLAGLEAAGPRRSAAGAMA